MERLHCDKQFSHEPINGHFCSRGCMETSKQEAMRDRRCNMSAKAAELVGRIPGCRGYSVELDARTRSWLVKFTFASDTTQLHVLSPAELESRVVQMHGLNETDWRTTEPEEYFTWRGRKLPINTTISVRTMIPIQSLTERATAGREKMIEATMQMWADGGGAMTRPFAERYVDGLAAEVGAMMATLNTVADGWQTRGDRRGMARKDLRRFIDNVLEEW